MNFIETLLETTSKNQFDDTLINDFANFIWYCNYDNNGNIISVSNYNDYGDNIDLFMNIFNAYTIKCLGSNLEYAGDAAIEGKSFILTNKSDTFEIWKFDIMNDSYDMGICIISSPSESLYKVREYEKVVFDYERV
jgi:hypothetical protein